MLQLLPITGGSYLVNLSCPLEGRNFGFLFNGHKVTGIQKESAADKEGQMRIGHRIIDINGKQIYKNTSTIEIRGILEDSCPYVTIRLEKGMQDVPYAWNNINSIL